MSGGEQPDARHRPRADGQFLLLPGCSTSPVSLAPLSCEIFRIIAGCERGSHDPAGRAERPAALQVADYAYVLEMGAVAMQGLARELADDRAVEASSGPGSKHRAMFST